MGGKYSGDLAAGGNSGSVAVAFAVQLHHLEGSRTGTGTDWDLGQPWLQAQLSPKQLHPTKRPPPLGDVDPPGANHRGPKAPPGSKGRGRGRGRGRELLPPPFSPGPAYLPHGLHLCQVPPAEPYPAPPPVGVVHLLGRHPGLGFAVRGDGDAIFPALGTKKGHAGEEATNHHPPPAGLPALFTPRAGAVFTASFGTRWFSPKLGKEAPKAPP